MSRIISILFLALTIFSFENAFAQNLKFKHISVEDGLSNSTIECIFQDHRGFIWFGTRDGLNKYDGNQITVYKNNQKATSLSDNFIRCIFEDKNKTLWIGTSDGLNKFNAEKDNFTSYRSKDKNATNTITSLAETDQGIWIGTYGGGLNLLKPEANAFEKFLLAKPMNLGRKNYIRDLYIDKNNLIWLATDEGVTTL
ncbi:MAG: hybrid sensor histidine kinase/response regulator, partial [Pedobacter sp.]